MRLPWHILPHLSVAKRGYVSRIPLYRVFNYVLYHLHTGCQWAMLPIREVGGVAELSYHAVYHHDRKWCADGSLERVFEASIRTVQSDLDLHPINLDGSHALAEKDGEAVAYQHRKHGKTSNILPVTDANGYLLATTEVVSGNHNDAYQLAATLRAAFQFMKALGLVLVGTYFNADSGFDTRAARRLCFDYRLIPNLPENRRARLIPKRGRKRLFNRAIYNLPFTAERTFAWIDKFRALLVRFDRKAAHFLGAHHIVFSLIHLRHLLATEKFQ